MTWINHEEKTYLNSKSLCIGKIIQSLIVFNIEMFHLINYSRLINITFEGRNLVMLLSNIY